MLLHIIFGLISCAFIYLKFIKPCWFWKNKGIKYARAWPGVGSLGGVIFNKEAFLDVVVKLYNKHPEERYVGYQQFRQPCLLVRDIDLIKQISVKDFTNFANHARFAQVETDFLLSKSLVGLSGQKWKNLRATLNPIFGDNVQHLYPLLAECAKNFADNFDQEIELEVSDVFTKVACNIIASIAFGVEIDCVKNPKAEFFKRSLQLVNFTTWQSFKLMICQTCPKLAKKLQLQIFPSSSIAFFKSLILESIKKREAEGSTRSDGIHLFLEARRGHLKAKLFKNVKQEGFATPEEIELDPLCEQVDLTDDYIVAQALTFFLTGFDTIATTCSFMAYELAVNPEIQNKLQNEIDGSLRKNNGKFSYDGIIRMTYLDQVVSETLRKWPPAFETDRLCIRDYQILPKRDDEKAFLVRKGVGVIFPIIAIHNDPQYYPEPERFKPERFNDENKSKVTPESYLPFGCGPRNCVGSRFALLEVKTLFAYLLSKFEIVPVAKTVVPIKIKKGQFSLVPEHGFWLGFKPRRATL